MKKILSIFLLFTVNLFSKNLILTSNQLTYTLTKKMTDNTNIEVNNVFDVYVDMFNQKNDFKNLENKEKVFENVDVVVDLYHIFSNDILYDEARRYNIRVVEIDLSRNYSELSSNGITLKYDNKGKLLNYFWLDFSNIYTMIKNLKDNLIKLYPLEKDKIEENSKNIQNRFLEIHESFMEEILKLSKDNSVIVLGEGELNYLLDSLEIYYQNISYMSNISDIEKLSKQTGIKKIVSVKNISSNLKKQLNDKGFEYQKLSLGNIGVDKDFDELLDDDGYYIFLKENLENLKKLLIK